MPTMSARPRSILDFALTSPATTILVATEPHIIHQMEKAAPGKTFIGVPGGDGNCNCNMCPYMALNTLEKLYVALRDLEPQDRAVAPRSWTARACRSSGCSKWPGGPSGRATSASRSSTIPKQIDPRISGD